MDRIKFYGKNDMTCSYFIDKSINYMKEFDKNKELDINDALECFNILEYYDNFTEIFQDYIEYKNYINCAIGKFTGRFKGNFLELYEDVYINYKDDFFKFINKFKIYKNIEEDNMKIFLENNTCMLIHILKQKSLVKKFEKILKDVILLNSKCAEMIIDRVYKLNNINMPSNIKNQDINDLLNKYISCKEVNFNYIDKIINCKKAFKSLGNEFNIQDKVMLNANRRYEEEKNRIFANTNEEDVIYSETNIYIKKNQKEPLELIIKNNIYEYSLSYDWIDNNKDYPTLLNNFIYVFEYFDYNFRLSFVNKKVNTGLFEELFFTELETLYSKNSIFDELDMVSFGILGAYYNQLKNLKIFFEDIIKWFFEDYLLTEFNIKNYIINIPSKNSTFFEKCRFILPEIESILKQYQLYVEHKKIDIELMQVSSNSLLFADYKSLFSKKYIYFKEKISLYYSQLLFSEKSTIYYLDKFKDKYTNFFSLITEENVLLNDFKEHQKIKINELIEQDFIYEKNRFLKPKNIYRHIIFKELYENNTINILNIENISLQYFGKFIEKDYLGNITNWIKKEIDILIDNNTLEISEKFFSKDEVDYLNYYLNMSSFGNSLDLRNKYMHGTQKNSEEEHYKNYVIFLRIVIIIIIKINDELCYQQDLKEEV